MQFARDVSEFLQSVRTLTPPRGLGPLGDLLAEELGTDPTRLEQSVESFHGHQLADLERALTVVADRHQGRWIGVGGAGRQHVDSLSDLVGGDVGTFVPGPVARVAVPSGPGTTRSVITFGIVVAMLADDRVACLLRGASPRHGRPMCTLDVLATSPAAGEQWITEVKAELARDTVLRGHVLSLQGNPFDFHGADHPLRFLPRPHVTAYDIVLPDGVLARITRHVIGVRRHHAALTRAGQHLKRGVLLYGPPGTGKTHVVRHLIGLSEGVTVILLSGRTLDWLSVATQLARAAAPAMIVMEDCDLVAEHRGGDTNAALFETLEAMDGLDGDADVAFVLTTNRPDLLERALVERPGRIDLAVEIGKPDEDGRHRLLRLYAPVDGAITDATLAEIAHRTDGATASFGKELMRRAVLLAAEQDTTAADRHALAACEEMLSDREAFTRALLGAGSSPWSQDQPVEDYDDADGWPD